MPYQVMYQAKVADLYCGEIQRVHFIRDTLVFTTPEISVIFADLYETLRLRHSVLMGLEILAVRETAVTCPVNSAE